MKYYLYISDSKIDMLWAQVPKKKLRQISTRLKINVKVLELSFKTEASDKTRYSKLAIVEDYIRSNFQLGTLHNPQNYFIGSIPMFSGLFRTGEFEYVLFCGEAFDRQIALFGSLKHVIGQSLQNENIKASPYLLGPMLEVFKGLVIDHGDGEFTTSTDDVILSNSIVTIHGFNKGNSQQLEFLARVLVQSPKLVLGTPLYVALAD